MDRIENQQFIIGRYDAFIESTQNKSNLYLTLNAVVIAGVITLLSTLKVEDLHESLIVLLVIISLISMISILITLVVINPFLRSSSDKKSVFFFKDVAVTKYSKYLKKINTISEDKILEDLVCQSYSLAQALKKKYKNLCKVGWLVAIQFTLLTIWVIIYTITKF